MQFNVHSRVLNDWRSPSLAADDLQAELFNPAAEAKSGYRRLYLDADYFGTAMQASRLGMVTPAFGRKYKDAVQLLPNGEGLTRATEKPLAAKILGFGFHDPGIA